ncbi:F-box domain containing protein [Tanacetum coccineum]
MDRLHSSNMLDIFSRVPAKCLARSRCVSKVWCEYIDDRYLTTVHDKQVIEEPTPILYHTRLSQDGKFRSLCFHVIESKQTETGTPVYFMCLGKNDGYAVTSLVVVHPLKKECYKVPPLPMRFDLSMFRESCGLGFDASTNTLKIVCVLLKDHGAVGNRKNLGDDPPKRMCDIWRGHNSCIDDHLVDLNGEVGFVCVRTMEIWLALWMMLNQYEKYVNEPKKSEVSKLFIGTAANGSTKWMLDSAGFVSGATTCSGAAKKSTAGELAAAAVSKSNYLRADPSMNCSKSTDCHFAPRHLTQYDLNRLYPPPAEYTHHNLCAYLHPQYATPPHSL